MKKHALFGLVLAAASMLITVPGYAKDGTEDNAIDATKSPSPASCKGLPSHADLAKALSTTAGPHRFGYAASSDSGARVADAAVARVTRR
jgi:hypothetical protein